MALQRFLESGVSALNWGLGSCISLERWNAIVEDTHFNMEGTQLRPVIHNTLRNWNGECLSHGGA